LVGIAGCFMMRGVALFSAADFLEVFLADAAIRAQPVFGYVFPFGAGGNTIIGPAFGLVIHPSTDNTFPTAHGISSIGIGSRVHKAGRPAARALIIANRRPRF